MSVTSKIGASASNLQISKKECQFAVGENNFKSKKYLGSFKDFTAKHFNTRWNRGE